LRPPALYEEGFVAALQWLSSQTWERYQVRVVISGEKPATPISDEFNALLFDCVRELLLNSIKHGEISEVTVSVREENDQLLVSVRDEGQGFDVAATGQQQAASGFGLFSIRERLQALGGDISIESAKGRGTCIQLQVPLSIAALTPPDDRRPNALKPAKVSRNPEEPRLEERNQGVRVLVVDDHTMVRQGLATLINDDERTTVVGEASDGLEAIEATERYQPDVILIDVNMPRMNGIEATREICRRWPNQIVIGLSVQADDTTADLMLKAGAKAFLSKGGNADHLIETIVGLNGQGRVARSVGGAVT
jgi:CheY-like chemotaxis protein